MSRAAPQSSELWSKSWDRSDPRAARQAIRGGAYTGYTAGIAPGSLGFVQYQDPAHRYVITRGRLLDDLCVLMGGREAEQLLLDDLSIGSAEDLRQARRYVFG